MESLYIDPSKNTPLIQFNFQKKNLLIKGKSYPENIFNFYEPVIKWLEQYVAIVQIETTFTFEIEYYNSGSSKVLFDIFSLIEDQSNIKFKIIWLYEEDDEIIKEAGDDFVDDFETLDITIKNL